MRVPVTVTVSSVVADGWVGGGVVSCAAREAGRLISSDNWMAFARD
jgi:hypothetical protein